MTSGPTWDPGQYLQYADHRTRPFRDLLARIPAPPAPAEGLRIADLGCGAGNVTAILAERWPAAGITGFDNSPQMLATAEREHAGPTPGGGRIRFRAADAAEWAPDETYDVIVSNALFHWVPGHADSFARWIGALAPGGVFAFQTPGNFGAPSHALLTELCESPRWRDRLGGDQGRTHTLDPADYLARLVGLGCAADVWETTYYQLLPGEDPVLEWLKGTTLRPVLTALADDGAAREAFLGEFRELLRAAYPAGPDGTVYPFRRIFAVAVKP
ncbi:trans-aconitate 2-methyltransferase [Streptomyces sp. CAU 1734]|uniref:trans-aconitate 2-methyltransferase n=1 Tax=Streptomyces sp. CAU 1734 TaxID=3140360 RepID=UPI00325FEBBE